MIVPQIGSSLSDPAPTSARLQTGEVWTFLMDQTPRIREAGIDVIVPAWWKDRKVKPAIRMHVKKLKGESTTFGISTLLDFDFRIALGDDLITPEEFFERVTLKGSLIRTGGGWATFDAHALERALKSFQDRVRKGFSAADLIRASAVPLVGGEVPLEVSSDDTWCRSLIDAARTGSTGGPRQVPASFCGTLRPYQEIGYSFLLSGADIRVGTCLADDMGLGKTPMTIAYLLARKEADPEIGPSLLICPTSVAGNWERELHRFAPSLSVHIHHGTGRERAAEFERVASSHDLVITTYALAARDHDHISRMSWASVILDEAQNIKNPHTKQARAISTLTCSHRVALTGTPVENRLSELWSIMNFLNRGYLGSLDQFRSTYAIPIEKSHNCARSDELKTIIRPFLLRRLKTDPAVITDLPEKMEYKVYCTLTREQATLYQAVVDSLSESVDEVGGIARKGRILSAITRLKQICDHPALLTRDERHQAGRSGKVQRLIEMLEEVREEGDAAIIFSQFATFATTLTELLEAHFKEKVLLLTGRVQRKRREELIYEFMRPNGPAIFVISLKAGGTGLNLTRATHVFHIDRWWNPAVEDQATDRAFRIGQTRDVQVHLMIAGGTLEERIDLMIEEKRGLAREVLGTGESWLTTMETSDLLEVISLRDSVFEGE
ncbi:MAG: DEAD/DEAH box helicase [Methanomicrobiales archaeon]|nr:DEAD/DEAH box helicase [Methanomicrobiales archaeon]